MTVISIVSTGENWIGYGVRSFSSTIKELIASAEKEIIMTVYVISDLKIVNSLRKSLDRGIHVEMYVYQPQLANSSQAIRQVVKFEKDYGHFVIHIVKGEVLHAKVLVVDSREVLIGSANPTVSGMERNYELGLLVKDGRIAQKVQTLLRRLT